MKKTNNIGNNVYISAMFNIESWLMLAHMVTRANKTNAHKLKADK